MIAKTLPLLALLFLGIWGGEVHSQCAYTSQPNAIDGIDATCYRYPICKRPNGNPRPCDTTNRATSPHLYMSTRQVGGIEQKMRAFLKFDLTAFGQMATECLPTSATLDLFYYRAADASDEHINSGTGNGNSFYIQRVTEDWREDTIRWMSPTSSGKLRMPAVSNLTDSKSRILVNASTSNTQDYKIDISDMLKFWMENPDSNFGVRLMLVDETLGNQVHLASSDYPDAQYRPKLSAEFPCTKANAGTDTLICSGDQHQLRAQGGASYLWAPIDGSNDILNKYDIYNPSFKPTKKQSFYVTSSIGTCSDKDTIELDLENRGFANIFSADTFLCVGDSMKLSAVGGSQFNWYPSNGLDATNLPTIYAKPQVSTMYYVEIKSPGETCPGIDSIMIEVRPLSSASINLSEVDLCSGDSIQLEASGGTIYNWTPSEGLSDATINNPYARPTDSTTYIVEVSSIGSCPDYDTVKVNITTGGFADAGNDISICEGDTAVLSAQGDGTVIWSPTSTIDDAFDRNTKAFPTTTTKYYLRIVTSGSSCEGLDSVTVTVNPKPIVKISPTDTIACLNEELTAIATGASLFEWSTGETSDKTVIIPTADTNLWVVGFDGTCYSDTLVANIATQKCSGTLVEAPKYFSPNGDGIQDKWVIKYLDRFPENEVTIINKWGDVVFNKKPYLNNWDGTYNGQEVAEETYMYLIKITFEGTTQLYKGTVTIIR